MTPDRLVIGAQDTEPVEILRKVYAKALAADTPLIVTDFETAELVKVAANAFLATKISFINSFAEVTETIGGDITTLADALGHDVRIGRKFLNAGVGFGGGCLPKDIRALQARVSELGLTHTMGFLAEVDEINLRRRERVVRLTHAMLNDDLVGKKIAVLGVTFKPDSDDVRDSPALDIAVRLYNAGAEVSVYDPKGNKNAAARFPRLDYATDLAEAVGGADVVLLLTEWAEFRQLTPGDLNPLVGSRRIIDGRNVLDRKVVGIGRVGNHRHGPALCPAGRTTLAVPGPRTSGWTKGLGLTSRSQTKARRFGCGKSAWGSSSEPQVPGRARKCPEQVHGA